MFVLVNLVGQLASCVMVLSRKHVNIACGMLWGIIALQVNSVDFIYAFIIRTKSKVFFFFQTCNFSLFFRKFFIF